MMKVKNYWIFQELKNYMNRNKIILLNKANKALKLLSEEYRYVNLTLNYSSIDLLLPGVTRIHYNTWEKLILMFNKNNISWNLKFENNYIVLNIFI